jgi:hypothetical protein
MFNLKGTLKTVKDARKVSDKFTIREFVVTDDSGQYPQVIQFQATQDKCSIMDDFKEGDSVNVYFNLRGREWTSPKDGEVKVFNTLEAWKVEGDGATVAEIPEAPAATGEDPDDLPF